MQESTAGLERRGMLTPGDVVPMTSLKEQFCGGKEELLDSLDTEPIFDYLLQHGVLDKATIDGICNEKTPGDRNTALLRHLEGTGNTAVALFINALRQSGQLHLASSLDKTQRIRPMTGSGYWEKQRHKGQVVVKIEVKAIKVLAPREQTPSKHSRHREVYDVKMTPRRLHKSYDNMLMLDAEEAPSPRAKRILDYPYSPPEDDDEPIKAKTSCWCMCFPMFRKRKTDKHDKGKKYQEKNSKSAAPLAPKEVRQTQRHESPVKYKSPRRKGSSGVSTQNGRSVNRSPLKDAQIEYKNNVNDRQTVLLRSPENKENMDPVIMRYNEQLQLVELKRYSTVHKTSPKENGHTRTKLCETWKSEGDMYEEKSSEFYGLFERDLKNSCIKYFEQDRGTLILQICSDNQGISVFNICMSLAQVTQLREDYTCGRLSEKLKALLLATGTIDRLEILDIELCVTIDDSQFDEAMQEFS